MFTILITFDILIFGVYVNSGYVIRVFHPFDTVHISKIVAKTTKRDVHTNLRVYLLP